MIEQLITDHLDLWSSAVRPKSSAGRGSNSKLELTGIKKLRELILELAVRGKLVPQDPNDEPASVLLERIAAEKARLVTEGKIKKSKPLSDDYEGEKYHLLPAGWSLAKLGDIFNIVYGKGLSSAELTSDGYDVFGANGVIGKYTSYIYETEQLLISCRGAYSGAANISPEKCFVTSNSLVLECSWNYLSLHYFYYALSAGDKSHIVTGSAQPQVTTANLSPYVIAIPPLAEQHRIVAKVDKLMSLCDQLEQKSEASRAAHQTLVETLLATLTESADSSELAQNWARLAQHFDSLFTTQSSIDALKQTILQLAVMGKLVPQDPNDEPASALLERIAAEKARLIKEGKIKKEKPLPPISEEEKPFALPDGWQYERVGTFCLVGTGATPSRTNNKYWESATVNWVSSGETSDLFVSETNEKISALAVKETNVTVYPVGTLIVAMYGQGKTRGQITELLVEAGTNQACAAIVMIEKSENIKNYIKIFFRKAYSEIREQAAGGAQPNLNVGKISTTVIPIPPIAEQHRIVTKVEELMSLCDQLSARLQASQTTQLHLAEALVEGALN
ncbi:type I restriction endonuclease EcoAI subunit S [Aeromonas caviae]|uniref:restriction endonuclease subunit S n=1 Tax=Aeromonas caviae TaxID=648 RepID=UPI001FBA4439|nr:restriction endonuclease subunit S [Aeromonas caviae]GKR03388.1 type I restriction endonuclease EcoAI subunit S [Aeromonas caviae]GKR12035.1 type I restriction endonuclease EcoAI subunit S [Aeromonas caviae]GKR16292.1 type I restriction endonuclease EcoAI subunit S [Aeromonas caviae]GKR20442.1 type I restriction endonuclease EcoAI subunit S [Aeromonas caviae]GKR41437.1 type I restriction endonuclease EcoAI subunit S [Aeromonas caviae]